jgi:hypothetical protein
MKIVIFTLGSRGAGAPSAATPFFGDQPFWGQRVYELGEQGE